MYDNTEIKVLEQIYLLPGIHKRGLSRQLKLGMPAIDHALKKISRLIIKKKSGNQIQHSLDYSKPSLAPAISCIEYTRFEKLPTNIKLALRDFLKELKEKPMIAAIFGSYAKNDYTKDSDIDIILVFQKLDNIKNIENTAKKISLRTNTEINPVYLDYTDFAAAFHNSTKEFFKNLRKDKIILIGIEWWRQLEDEET